MKKIIISIMMVALMVSFVSAIDINSCSQILGSGDYDLTQDIEIGSGTCIIFQGDNTLLDCHGYQISNNATATTGVEFESNLATTNLTIQNCLFFNFDGEAINAGNTTDVTIRNNTFTQNNVHLQSNVVTGEAQVKDGFIIDDNTFNFTTGGQAVILKNNDEVLIQNNDFVTISTSGDAQIEIASQLSGETYTSIQINDNTFYIAEANNTRDAMLIGSDASWDVSGLEINGNTIEGFSDAILITDPTSSSEYLNAEIVGNTFTEVGGRVVQAYALNGGTIEDNVATRSESLYFTLMKYDVRGSTGVNVENNSCTGATGDATTYCFRSYDSSDITFDSNTADLVYFGFDCRDSTGCSFINNIINDAEVADPVYGGEPFAIRFRGTSSGNTITGNVVTSSNISLVFRTGSDVSTTIIGNNTFNTSKLGIDFTDATIASSVVIKNNNFVSLTDNFDGASDSATIEENYYADGDVASEVGYCVTTPYNDSGITDDSPFCCINGWILGCDFTPAIPIPTGAVTFYNEDDIAEATINTLVKGLITLGTLLTILVVFVLYTYAVRLI